MKRHSTEQFFSMCYDQNRRVIGALTRLVRRQLDEIDALLDDVETLAMPSATNPAKCRLIDEAKADLRDLLILSSHALGNLQQLESAASDSK